MIPDNRAEEHRIQQIRSALQSNEHATIAASTSTDIARQQGCEDGTGRVQEPQMAAEVPDREGYTQLHGVINGPIALMGSPLGRKLLIAAASAIGPIANLLEDIEIRLRWSQPGRFCERTASFPPIFFQ